MNLAATVGVGVGTTGSVGAHEARSLPEDESAPKGPAVGMTAAGMDAGPEPHGSWKNLLEALGLTVQNSMRTSPGGGEAMSSPTADGGKVQAQAAGNAGAIGELRPDQRIAKAAPHGQGELRGSAGSAGSAAGANKASAGHPGKAKPAQDASAPSGTNSPAAGTELIAAPSPAIGVASPVSPLQQTQSTERVLAPGQNPPGVSAAGLRDMESEAWPNGNGSGEDSIAATGQDKKIPSAPERFSEASPIGETAAPHRALVDAQHNPQTPLFSPTLNAEQAGGTTAPFGAGDFASPGGKHAQPPIPALPAGPLEPSPAAKVSPVVARASTSAREMGAKPGTLKGAGNGGGTQGPPNSNDTLFLNAPVLRDPGPVAGMAEKPAGTPQLMGAAASNPFGLLDAAPSAPPTWIRAGAHHAEAGYLDPQLGWVSVRADVTAGGIHAALVPVSGEAAQVLGSHVAGLNAYLSEHHREPAIVTMAAPQDGRDGTGTGSHAGQGDSARQQGAQDRQDWNAKASASIPRELNRVSPAVSETGAVRALSPDAKYISVVA